MRSILEKDEKGIRRIYRILCEVGVILMIVGVILHHYHFSFYKYFEIAGTCLGGGFLIYCSVLAIIQQREKQK